MAFQFLDDLANLVGLVGGFVDQVIKNGPRPVRIAGTPETGCGADPAAAGKVGVPSPVVVVCEDQFKMGCGQEMLSGFRLELAHFCEHASLDFP